MRDLSMHYILDGHEVVPVDLMTWAKWFEENERHVAQTDVGPYWVSTVFLGLDMQYGDGPPPLLFETMVFKRDKDGPIDFSELDQDRYSTWDEAVAGHERMVAKWKEKVDA